MPDSSSYWLRQEQLSLSGPALQGVLQATLEQGAALRFRAYGSSMIPFIENGDVICIKPLEGRPPRLGDVVAFAHPHNERLVVHRVVGRVEQAWLVQGDNSPLRAWDVVADQHLRGCLVSVERDGRILKIGLGPERRLVAFLSRLGLLQPLIRLILLARGRHVG